MKCKKVHTKLSAYLDGDLAESKRVFIEKHLKKCENCSAELKMIQTVMTGAASFKKMRAPETLWAKIDNQLNLIDESLLNKINRKLITIKIKIEETVKVPIPVIQTAAVIAILLVGILIGRHFFPKLNFVQVAEKNVIHTEKYQMISTRTNQYIDKSKILFLGLINANKEDAKKMDWSTEKRVAKNLVQEAVFLKDNLSEKRNAQIRQLVEDLELILLELANMEEQFDFENIEMIKSGIERQGVLLKINLYDMSEPQITPENNDLNRTL